MGIFLVERTFESKDFLISEFKRNQSAEELRRVKLFAKEVRELLRHCDLSISFPKFIPAYHQYFGKQCRVSNYGVAKLTELFECIPHTVQMVKTTLHPYTPDPSNAKAKAIKSGFPKTSRTSFHQHILHLAPSPLIAQQHSSPFLVQPIARTTIDWVDIDRLQSVHNRDGDSVV